MGTAHWESTVVKENNSKLIRGDVHSDNDSNVGRQDDGIGLGHGRHGAVPAPGSGAVLVGHVATARPRRRAWGRPGRAGPRARRSCAARPPPPVPGVPRSCGWRGHSRWRWQPGARAASATRATDRHQGAPPARVGCSSGPSPSGEVGSLGPWLTRPTSPLRRPSAAPPAVACRRCATRARAVRCTSVPPALRPRDSVAPRRRSGSGRRRARGHSDGEVAPGLRA